MDNNNIITFLACICFLFIFGKIFIVPLKKVLKIVLNSILGGVFIYIVNLIGASSNFHIGLNFFTTILIRNIGVTRSCVFDCYKIAYWVSCYFDKGTLGTVLFVRFAPLAKNI